MIKQRVKKIEKQAKGPNYYSEKRVEALYNYLLTGDESYNKPNLGIINAAEIYLALKKAKEKAKKIGIEKVKVLYAWFKEQKKEYPDLSVEEFLKR